MAKTFVCDIDGTVADCSHRLHYIRPEWWLHVCGLSGFGVGIDAVNDVCQACSEKPPKPNWKMFFAACTEDRPITDVIWMIRLLHDAGQKIIYMSGRSDEVRAKTALWLLDNNLPPGPLYMRQQGDHRPDWIVKSELLDEVLKDTPREDIAGFFDDRQQVVDMYRRRGFRVYQVAAGDF